MQHVTDELTAEAIRRSGEIVRALGLDLANPRPSTCVLGARRTLYASPLCKHETWSRTTVFAVGEQQYTTLDRLGDCLRGQLSTRPKTRPGKPKTRPDTSKHRRDSVVGLSELSITHEVLTAIEKRDPWLVMRPDERHDEPLCGAGWIEELGGLKGMRDAKGPDDDGRIIQVAIVEVSAGKFRGSLELVVPGTSTGDRIVAASETMPSDCAACVYWALQRELERSTVLKATDRHAVTLPPAEYGLVRSAGSPGIATLMSAFFREPKPVLVLFAIAALLIDEPVSIVWPAAHTEPR